MIDRSHHCALNGRNVLITGGLGFIGSNLAHALVEIGNVNVTILDAMIPGQGGNLFNVQSIMDDVEVRIGDMGDEATVVPLISGVDFIFNLVGTAGHIDSMSNPRRDLVFNCSAQLTLLEACRNFNPNTKIVFASTRQVYGKPQYLPVDEHHRVAPLDINGAHKLAAENYHQIYHRVHGIRTVCLRLTNTYGPRQLLSHDRQGFIPWFIRKSIDGETIPLFGGGRQRRDLNFVDDVVEALLLAATDELADGDVFNLGAEKEISLEQFARELIKITGRGRVESVAFPPERQGIEIGNIYSSHEKIMSVLGWRPQIDLKTGLTRTVEYYLQNREHYWNGSKLSVSRSLQAA
jgi:UDP-glucose 4-epimerase